MERQRAFANVLGFIWLHSDCQPLFPLWDLTCSHCLKGLSHLIPVGPAVSTTVPKLLLLPLFFLSPLAFWHIPGFQLCWSRECSPEMFPSFEPWPCLVFLSLCNTSCFWSSMHGSCMVPLLCPRSAGWRAVSMIYSLWVHLVSRFFSLNMKWWNPRQPAQALSFMRWTLPSGGSRLHSISLCPSLATGTRAEIFELVS